MNHTPSKLVKASAIACLAICFLALLWYTFFAIKQQPIPQDEILDSYTYQAPEDIKMTLKDIGDRNYSFSYRSFDGAVVNGQISYPSIEQESYPVVIGISAMGRSHQRWWTGSYKGRPTVTRVNEIGRSATEKGYVVVAIDARYHGMRKDPKKTLRSIMNNLHFFGDKTDYEEMVRNTVQDYRVLIDWIRTQKKLDSSNLNLVGYSMGAQIALLIGGLDAEINRVIAVAPPYLDDKTAAVAPKNLASRIVNPEVLLITASDDEFASHKENQHLYTAIASSKKEHLTFKGNHILPGNYIDALVSRL
ncbi:dienelactone hydrolase family protein [Microbulbifer sp. ALW1]|uniref:dienelactone hydrolase family protein n=1 Tax=Microbulbifer sp. (strain ALW1) TaxID=1516059 RepID=UPI001358538A|nr:alpha/beta fold hydrolase [Microbulbifer sp. ALW1]